VLTFLSLFTALNPRDLRLATVALLALTHSPELFPVVVMLAFSTSFVLSALLLLLAVSTLTSLSLPLVFVLSSAITFLVVIATSVILAQLYAFASALLIWVFLLTGSEQLLSVGVFTTQVLALSLAYFFVVNLKLDFANLLLAFFVVKPLFLMTIFLVQSAVPFALSVVVVFAGLVLASSTEIRLMLLTSSAMVTGFAFNAVSDFFDIAFLALALYSAVTIALLTSFHFSGLSSLLLLVFSVGLPVSVPLFTKMWFTAVSDYLDLTLVLGSYVVLLGLFLVLIRSYASTFSAGWILLAIRMSSPSHRADEPRRIELWRSIRIEDRLDLLVTSTTSGIRARRIRMPPTTLSSNLHQGLLSFGDVVGPSRLSRLSRRQHALSENAVGVARCIACSLCSSACPVDCLFVGLASATSRLQLVSWSIDRKRCVYCGNCSAVCPVVAITQSASWSLSQRVLVEALDPV
jgi:ferredoxin